jgi:hypothetical protein
VSRASTTAVRVRAARVRRPSVEAPDPVPPATPPVAELVTDVSPTTGHRREFSQVVQ